MKQHIPAFQFRSARNLKPSLPRTFYLPEFIDECIQVLESNGFENRNNMLIGDHTGRWYRIYRRNRTRRSRKCSTNVTFDTICFGDSSKEFRIDIISKDKLMYRFNLDHTMNNSDSVTEYSDYEDFIDSITEHFPEL